MGSLRFTWMGLALALVGCADGGGGVVGTDAGSMMETDAGEMMSGTDAGEMMSGTDAGGMVGCPTGQHACGAGCIDDLANEPANGCRYGCGEPCPTPPDGMAACDEDGECTFGCEPPFREMDGMCVCTPRTCEDWGYTCGAPDDGCGMLLDCGSCAGGGVCLDGACSCMPDEREPNDGRLEAPNIGSATDAPDTNLVFDSFNLDEMGDEDWFQISVADDFDAGNPRIHVTLRGIPMGDDYDLGAYYVCDSGGDSTSCAAGAVDNSVGRGCTSSNSGDAAEDVELETECSGTDEAGILYLHITGPTVGGSCQAYEIEVDVT